MRPSEVAKEGSEDDFKTEVSSIYLVYVVLYCELPSTCVMSHVLQCSSGT